MFGLGHSVGELDSWTFNDLTPSPKPEVSLQQQTLTQSLKFACVQLEEPVSQYWELLGTVLDKLTIGH